MSENDEQTSVPGEPPPAPKVEPTPIKHRYSGVQQLGTAALAIVLYLLLLDAAVETLLSGSPVRWIVAGAAAGYFTLSVLVWRRLSWSTKAAASLLVMLGLLAVTAWLPDGLDQGVSLLRQPTSTVLAGTTGLAILLAGVILVQWKFVPQLGRLVVGLVAAYGLAAIGLGIAQGTPYSDLLHGRSFWNRLPFWLHGAFIGTLVLVPGAVLSQLSIFITNERIRQRLIWGTRMVALSLIVAMAASALIGPVAGAPFGSIQAGNRGPGMRRPDTESLQLPVPRTFDLTHIEPIYLAAALGKDPSQVFRYVRDQIGYEAYTGYLRGPRGTLMAMAGNSVDRAALLGSLLELSGQRVRYAHGVLSEGLARELIASMWIERRQAPWVETSGGQSQELKAASDTLVSGIRHDYAVLRDYLKKAGQPSTRDLGINPEALLKQAQDHYWVQWSSNGKWVDLDPSFLDAMPGQTYGRLKETFDSWPAALFHRVVIRVHLEEYAGDKPSSRDLLQYTAKAADLSGKDLILTHQPEKWRGPSENILSALAPPAQEIDTVKPVLLVPGGPPIVGESFRLRAHNSPGAGDLGSFLAGQGTSNTAPLATAESIKCDFLTPGGRQDTVVREIFDLVGKARRARRLALTDDEVETVTRANDRLDVTDEIYSLFFTTGGIDAAHLANLSFEDPSRNPQEASDIGALLRRISIAFAASSDVLMARLAGSGGAVHRFYLDSPRLHIAEVVSTAGVVHVALDLRRDRARGVGTGLGKEALFFSKVLRGVVLGTIERVLMDYINTPRPDVADRGPAVSTSLLFERARAGAVRLVLLTHGSTDLAPEVPENARALVDQALAAGYSVLAPKEPIALADVPRFAWWQIDPRSGETIAETDDGRLGTMVEYKVIINKAAGTGIIWMAAGGRVFHYIKGSAPEIYRIIGEIITAGQKLAMVSWE